MRFYRSLSLVGRGFDDFTALVLAAFRAHAMRQFRLVAIRALREGGLTQSIVRAAVLSARIGVSSFRIRHCFLNFPRPLVPALFDVNVFERDPAIVARLNFASGGISARAIGLVPIRPARRTDSFAGFAADGLHRELQQNLLPQDIFQHEAGQSIKSISPGGQVSAKGSLRTSISLMLSNMALFGIYQFSMAMKCLSRSLIR